MTENAETASPGNQSVLTLDLAKQIAAGCAAHAAQQGWAMNIAVFDEGGNRKYFERMDGAYLLSGAIAEAKARTSAGLPMSTRQFREISREEAVGLDRIPGTSSVAGGLPIISASGRWLGGLGVSGGTEDQDEQCAQAGLDAASAQPR